MGCWSCGSEEKECYQPCDCAKCIDPEGYQEWKEEYPERYEKWLEDQGLA